MGTKSNAYSAIPRRISNRLCFGTMQLFEEVLCEGSARRDAGEVGDVNSDGGIRI
jgi:hypothetical protein